MREEGETLGAQRGKGWEKTVGRNFRLPYPGGGIYCDTMFDQHICHWNVTFLCYQVEGSESTLEEKEVHGFVLSKEFLTTNNQS